MKGEGMSRENDPAGVLMQRIGDACDAAEDLCPGSKATILMMAAACLIEMEMPGEMEDEAWCSAILQAVARARFVRQMYDGPAVGEAPFMTPTVGEA
jgi:hypothetical protein